MQCDDDDDLTVDCVLKTADDMTRDDDNEEEKNLLYLFIN